ncbi:MAG: hypothetical protein HY869_01330 [Chloroflexi bacterium]|nr:hypothetical protein [Chloroflexota bacterium]
MPLKNKGGGSQRQDFDWMYGGKSFPATCGFALRPGWMRQAGNCAPLRPPNLAEITEKPAKSFVGLGKKTLK